MGMKILIEIFFSVKKERRTRGHGVTLTKKQCRLDIRKFSFSQITVKEWNRLSADGVRASRVTWGSPAPLREKLCIFVSITCRCIIVQ